MEQDNLFETLTQKRLSVTQLTAAIKDILEGEFYDVWVEGEISNLRKPASGHTYLTLKDGSSQIRGVIWRSASKGIKFLPEDGMLVVVRGRITVYERRGDYQLVIEYIEPKGVGALQLAFEQLKQKLMKEGLFDKAHKKPLPFLPQKIGVVTSSTGAALKDILRVIERRFANVQITLYPVRVQGEEAPAEIAEAIRAFNHLPSLGRDLPMVDVIIVGRGGGSLEDLWAFNEEVVARAVFDSSIPVISAVGHEIDVTILDMVADTRAPTPSAAAEMVVSNKEDVVRRLNDLKSRLINSARAAINVYTERLEGLSGRSPFAMPFERTARLQQQADELTARLNREIEVAVKAAGERFTGTRQSLHLLAPTNLINRYHDRVFTNYRGIVSSLTSLIENKSHIFKELAGRMNSMSPLAVMERGYSICYKLPEMEVINDSSALSSGDGLRIRFSRGSAVCRIEDRILEGDDNVGN